MHGIVYIDFSYDIPPKSTQQTSAVGASTGSPLTLHTIPASERRLLLRQSYNPTTHLSFPIPYTLMLPCTMKLQSRKLNLCILRGPDILLRKPLRLAEKVQNSQKIFPSNILQCNVEFN